MSATRAGSTPVVTALPDTTAWHDAAVEQVKGGARFAGLYADDDRLIAILDGGRGFELVETFVRRDADGAGSYPSLSNEVPPAFWYERAAYDLSGLMPIGHPRPDPLLLPLHPGSDRPAPGASAADLGALIVSADTDTPGPVDLSGHGLLTLTFGPVRSGVSESIEFLLETPGEDIPHLNIRPHFKHRGIAKRFESLAPRDAVLVAERVEGIASVAHALAFCHAVESAAGTRVPPRAQLLRVIYAELERIANHLECAMRLSEAAGLGVAISRFAWHKELVMRTMSALTGSRFGRGATVPGGVRAPHIDPSAAFGAEWIALKGRVLDDARRVMRTSSFLDRLRGTGVLDGDYARRWALLGPIGRASGHEIDARWQHPYDGYEVLRLPVEPAFDTDGDARARLRVRWQEVATSFDLIAQSVAALPRSDELAWSSEAEESVSDGPALGVAEGPQGEVLYSIRFENGVIARCLARSPALHDLVAFRDAFHSDVFTDFAFIEASFGLSYAGVAM
ncbi:hydrogenase large subunit [Humibacter ginsenosidimutans]|uniref:NADH-quinone oxidoreductase subunit D n=1 Tax=Humibacter ginsenosidimutans TaxID=2599293 RepID=A0A5B8M0I7_9MICO|nr:nickel-dependent hydrogenase large subunit [Humibacter ginsenosidimutans]QDZ14338.1 NADH-quinone oxidoreductase subunit D [Humibacter ginsenosidimutans]